MKRKISGSRPAPGSWARSLPPKDRYNQFLEKLDAMKLDLYDSIRAALANSDDLRRDVKDLSRRVDFIEESLAAIGTRKKIGQPHRNALVVSRKRGAR